MGKGHAPGLGGHRLGDLADAVADVDHQRASGGIYIAPAVGIVEVNAFAALDGGVIVAQSAVKNVSAHLFLPFSIAFAPLQLPP